MISDVNDKTDLIMSSWRFAEQRNICRRLASEWFIANRMKTFFASLNQIRVNAERKCLSMINIVVNFYVILRIHAYLCKDE